MKVESPKCAQVNLLESREVVRYFKDLLNLSKFLKNGLDYELAKFRKQLVEVGWSEGYIFKFLHIAACGTVYERYIPSPIPNQGDQKEFERNKYRWKK